MSETDLASALSAPLTPLSAASVAAGGSGTATAPHSARTPRSSIVTAAADTALGSLEQRLLDTDSDEGSDNSPSGGGAAMGLAVAGPLFTLSHGTPRSQRSTG